MCPQDVHILYVPALTPDREIGTRLANIDRYDVHRKTRIQAALDAVATEDIDCIVTIDDGSDASTTLLRRLRSREGDTTPFVFLAADPDETIVREALNAGADRFHRVDAVVDDPTLLATAIDESVQPPRRDWHAAQQRWECERLFEHMNVGVASQRIITDDEHDPIDYEFVDVNGAGCDTLGIDSAQALPVSASALFEQDPPPLLDRYQTVLETGEPLSFETYLQSLESWYSSVAYSPDGTRIVTVFEDVTARRERQRELELFREMADQAQDAIFVTDAETGIIEDVNETACDRLGYERSELEGAGVWDISGYFSDRAAFRRHLRQQDGDPSSHIETVHERKDGTEIPVEIMASTVEMDEHTCRVAMARDITERKARERELRDEKERLEEFASVLSHDLRTPLEVATGRLELASETVESDHLSSAKRALTRIDEIIEDVLTLVRDGSTVDADAIETVSLASVARSCWQTVSTAEAALRVETDNRIDADPGRLRELFENLYRNAVEHGGDDVTVVVGDFEDGFYIADDGAGIPPTDREAVFEAGYSTRECGSGLGLSIVESIAQAHGWCVDITESERGGARFEFTGLEASID
ncbi:PAS domain S-box protein [Halorhabdus sp. CBA1104]|uniref:PAS domain S-box protein n=1 Tax=Halorhabdus sp. CBA1104 TaxID=1380432 RepID=UPI0012B2FD38|nr:PAS domain S-box protein [Halorhabdus sp. CBA1104]QGN06332.1 PAS domain S-box protein [Halorhabdus sp. CBA1104]